MSQVFSNEKHRKKYVSFWFSQQNQKYDWLYAFKLKTIHCEIFLKYAET